jgi:hypothetical protein
MAMCVAYAITAAASITRASELLRQVVVAYAYALGLEALDTRVLDGLHGNP